jgi:hypothetical protein
VRLSDSVNARVGQVDRQDLFILDMNGRHEAERAATPRTLRHRRADRIIVSLSHVPNQIVTLGQQRKHSLDGPWVLKFASGVSLAATFDGEFSDVTRSYARQGRGALAQSKPAPA